MKLSTIWFPLRTIRDTLNTKQRDERKQQSLNKNNSTEQIECCGFIIFFVCYFLFRYALLVLTTWLMYYFSHFIFLPFVQIDGFLFVWNFSVLLSMIYVSVKMLYEFPSIHSKSTKCFVVAPIYFV